MVVTPINHTLLLLLVLLGSVQQTIGTEVFTILWKFPNIPSNSPLINQCGPTFQSVRDALYKTFVLEVLAETNITMNQVTKLDPDWNVTNTTLSLQQRRLLDNNVVQDTGSNNNQVHTYHVQQPQQQRILRGRCITDLCQDDAYIIRLAGCTTWCHRNGRLRNLRGEQRELDSSDDSSDDNKSSPVQKPVQQPIPKPVQKPVVGPSINGDRKDIKWKKPGAQTVYDVYYAIDQLPISDPCRTSLLALKYRISFVDTSQLYCD